MSLSPSSLLNTTTTSSTAYVPLNKRDKQKIEVPQDPQAELQLVKDLYEKASVPTFEEKSKAPYEKIVDPSGDITLEPNDDFEGPTYQINGEGKVLVKPKPYELEGLVDIKEQPTDPKVIEEVQQLIAQAKPQEEIPERSLEVGYKKGYDGDLEILKKGIDGTDQHYTIKADGSVSVYQVNDSNHFRNHKILYSQQIVKPGELPVLKEGEERPVGTALNEASCSPEAKSPTNGQLLNVEV